jgi:DedD protein
MNDQGVREIQLSGKQLVFLFMAAVVFTVAVFLLGVSVGRGVRDNTGGAVMASVPGGTKPPEVPPPTKTGPGDLTYDTALQTPKAGEGTKAPDLPKVGSPDPAKQRETQGLPPATSPPPPPPPPTETKTPSPAATKATPPAETKSAPAATKPAPAAAPAATGAYWVQVGLFKDRSNAEKLVRELKAEGVVATLQPAGGSVRVRVGPFDDRTQAEATAKRLARHKAMVTR